MFIRHTCLFPLFCTYSILNYAESVQIAQEVNNVLRCFMKKVRHHGKKFAAAVSRDGRDKFHVCLWPLEGWYWGGTCICAISPTKKLQTRRDKDKNIKLMPDDPSSHIIWLPVCLNHMPASNERWKLMSNINRSDPTSYSDSTDIDDLSISSDAGNTAAPLKYGRGPATNFDSDNSNIIHLGKSRKCHLKLSFYFIFERLYSAHFVHKGADESICLYQTLPDGGRYWRWLYFLFSGQFWSYTSTRNAGRHHHWSSPSRSSTGPWWLGWWRW